VGRAGWSIACNLGLRELVAETPEQFVTLAARRRSRAFFTRTLALAAAVSFDTD